jgi:hypothetical protein
MYIKSIFHAAACALKSRKSTAAYRLARAWSNDELLKFSGIFGGNILNVSAANDSTKCGDTYQAFFSKADTYTISNYSLQGMEKYNEFFLDLEKPLDKSLFGSADVVFNHTTLEHIFNVTTAFQSLCLLSKDVVIVVVPFLQKMHGRGAYNDYWRFTPELMKRLYQENGLTLRYCSDNCTPYASTYLFCIGYRDPKWDSFIPNKLDNMMHPSTPDEELIGGCVFKNSLYRKFRYFLTCSPKVAPPEKSCTPGKAGGLR